MWHNVRERFDALGVDNVVWVMNYIGYVTAHCVDEGPLARQRLRRLGDVGSLPEEHHAGPRPSNTFYNYLTANSDAEHDFLSKPWGLGRVRLRRQQPDRGLRDVRRGAAQPAERRAPEAQGLHRLGQLHLQQPRRPGRLHRDPRGRPGRAAALQRLRQRPAADGHRRTRADRPDTADGRRCPPRRTPDRRARARSAWPGRPPTTSGWSRSTCSSDGEVVATATPDEDGAVAVDWNSATVPTARTPCGCGA